MNNLCRLFQYHYDPQKSNRRFLVLTVHCVLTACNAMQWLTYAPLNTESKRFFDINTDQLNLLSTVYMFVYITLVLLSCLGIESLGLRNCLLIGSGLNFFGALLKVVLGFPAKHFPEIFVAQFVCAVAQVFTLSVPPSLSDVWFPPSQRATSTAIGAVANSFGCALGMLIPPMIVKNVENTEKGFLYLFIFQLALATVAFAGVLFGVPTPVARFPPDGKKVEELEKEPASDGADEKTNSISNEPVVPAEDSPASPASPASPVVQPEREPTSVKEVFIGVWHVMRDRDCVTLMLGISISTGIVWALNSLLAQLLASINIGEIDAGWMGFWNIMCGTALSIISGLIVDRYRVYKWPLIGMVVFSLVMMIFMLIVTAVDKTKPGDDPSTASLVGLYFLVIISGIPQNVVLTIGFEFAMEVAHGHPGSITGGAFMCLSNLVSFIVVTIGSVILTDAEIAPKKYTMTCYGMLIGLLVLGLLLLIITRNKLRRLKAERAAEKEAKYETSHDTGPSSTENPPNEA